MPRYLIGYDIPNPKRLQRLHREISKFATALQYSVFLYEGSEKAWSEYLKKILRLLNLKEDDLRIYPLHHCEAPSFYGKPLYPEGIFWSIIPA